MLLRHDVITPNVVLPRHYGCLLLDRPSIFDLKGSQADVTTLILDEA